jgi:hypothetical protein
MEEYKSDIQAAWYAAMREKYGTDDDGVRQIMADRQKQSMASPKRKEKPHVGGFNLPGVAKQAGELGRKTRYSGRS